ncbi:MAG TPA: type II toxin-antitoxin system VapC family toxin [Rickettsia endosymbiont of Pyrocoelia pectoralis]|nr:type II toxin-antitoxin system VapC family toxin [Rickettsia endosymbiont of Pyrocoelia pectoralis]
MNYLIDTNVICELVKTKQSTHVLKWFNSIESQKLYLSVLTIGEIRKGLEKITDIRRKDKIRIWLDQELESWFKGRILPIDQQVANKWGLLQAMQNKTLPAIDSLIAATALHFDLILVTRNIKDFNHCNLEVIDPFSL